MLCAHRVRNPPFSMPSKIRIFSQWIEIRLHLHHYGQFWPSFTFLALKKLIAVTSGWLFWCCLLFFSWNVRDNARTLSGLCSPSRGGTKTVKLMKEIIIQELNLLGYCTSQAKDVQYIEMLVKHIRRYFTSLRCAFFTCWNVLAF